MMRTALLVPFAALAIGLGPVGHADPSWRTPGGDIVTTGMSKAEVLARAGRPDYAEDLGCAHAETHRSAFYYVVGQPPNRLAVTIVFRGTEVERIETAVVR